MSSPRSKTGLQIILFLLLLYLCALYTLLLSPFGVKGVLQIGLPWALGCEPVLIQGLSGNLLDGFTIERLQIRNIPQLPVANELKFRDLHFTRKGWRFRDWMLQFGNSKLELPDSGTFHFSGKFSMPEVNVTLSADQISLSRWQSHVPALQLIQLNAGEAHQVTAQVTGSLTRGVVHAGGRLSGVESLYQKDGKAYIRVKIPYQISRQEVLWKIEGYARQAQTRPVMDLPDDTTIRIQELFLFFDPVPERRFYLEFRNARLQIPQKETILVNGKVRSDGLDLNVYSNRLSLRDIFPYIEVSPRLALFSGEFKHLDLYLKGAYHNLHLEGDAVVEEFRGEHFKLVEMPLRWDLVQRINKGITELHGQVISGQGEFHLNHSMIQIREGQVNFSGLIESPDLFINGRAEVEKVKIVVEIRGTPGDPDIDFASTPHHPEDEILLMLITGKRWKSLEKAKQENTIPPELMADIVSYLLFNRGGPDMGRWLGVEIVQLKLSEADKRLELSKDISNRLRAGYLIHQQRDLMEQSQFNQKVIGEYQLNRRISVDVEKSIATGDGISGDPLQNEDEDKVVVRYRKRF